MRREKSSEFALRPHSTPAALNFLSFSRENLESKRQKKKTRVLLCKERKFSFPYFFRSETLFLEFMLHSLLTPLSHLTHSTYFRHSGQANYHYISLFSSELFGLKRIFSSSSCLLYLRAKR